ncbi:putative trehalose synthase [Tuber brumale]|nr:putative trehalose synthase [Tuber brumale]
MDAPEAPLSVTDPVDTAPPQNETTGETVWGEIPLVVSLLPFVHYFTREFTCSDGEYTGDGIRKNTIHIVVAYSISRRAKFVGAGVTLDLEEICPGFCAYIWTRLDIFRVISKASTTPSGTHLQRDTPIDLDEQADLAARECVRFCGPDHNPALAICFRNKVMPDGEGAIRLVKDLQPYKETVHESTWKTVLSYAYELMGYKDGQTNGNPQSTPTKIALLSTTPQGGGVALMRHALVRFCTQLGVDMSWFVFISSMAHDIYLLICDRFDKGRQDLLDEWMRKNAERYWLSPGGSLAPGGADVVIIDDPQMPALIPLIKKVRPEVKIICRSHIEARKDLVAIGGSPQRQVWEWIWNQIRKADVFISHPVSTFMVGLMPACTDWCVFFSRLLSSTNEQRLDGLNKPLCQWHLRFYHHNLHNLCNEREMNHLLYPTREYIAQIARFHPSKGIPDVIESYRHLCVRLRTDAPEGLPPQLLICGHGAIDDPDAEIVYNETIALLRQWRYAPIAKDVIVVRIGPSDQMLNAMITTAKNLMQLSLREGFEVKVSEALHHGKPVVATRAGGIPLQIEDGKSGFLVEVGDTDTVANCLFDLYTNDDLYARMSKHAKASVSDEVGTVGNADCWLYLDAKLARGEGLAPNTGWIMDLARAEAGHR